MADLLEIGFRIKAEGLAAARKELNAFLSEVGSVATKGEQATKQIEGQNKRKGKSAEDAAEKISKALELEIKQYEIANKLIKQGVDPSQALTKGKKLARAASEELVQALVKEKAIYDKSNKTLADAASAMNKLQAEANKLNKEFDKQAAAVAKASGASSAAIGREVSAQRMFNESLQQGMSLQEAKYRFSLKRKGAVEAEINELVRLKKLNDSLANPASSRITPRANSGASPAVVRQSASPADAAKKNLDVLNAQVKFLNQGLTRAASLKLAKLEVSGVDQKTINSIKDTSKEVDRLGKSFGQLKVTSKGVDLKAILGVGLGGAGLGVAAGYVLTLADAYTLLQARMRYYIQEGESVAAINEKLLTVANSSRASLQDVTNLFAKLNPAIQRIGGTTADTINVTEAFSKSLFVGGANIREASAATIQFAQALASGKLAGDEFRSIAEASPRVLYALQDALGATAGELKEMSKEGKLTTEVVSGALLQNLALLRIESEAMGKTVGGGLNVLKNSLFTAVGVFESNTKAASTLGGALEQVGFKLIDLSKSFANGLVRAKEFADENKRAIDLVLTSLGYAIVAWVSYKTAVVAATVVTTTFAAVSSTLAVFGAVYAGITTAVKGMTAAVVIARSVTASMGLSLGVLALISSAWIAIKNGVLAYRAAVIGATAATEAFTAAATLGTGGAIKAVGTLLAKVVALGAAYVTAKMGLEALDSITSENGTSEVDQIKAESEAYRKAQKEKNDLMKKGATEQEADRRSLLQKTIDGLNREYNQKKAQWIKEGKDIKVLTEQYRILGEQARDASKRGIAMVEQGAPKEKPDNSDAKRLADENKRIQQQIADLTKINDLISKGVEIDVAKKQVEDERLISTNALNAGLVAQNKILEENVRLEKERAEIKKMSDDILKDLSEEERKGFKDFMKPEKLEIGDLFGESSKSAGALINAFQEINKNAEEYQKIQNSILLTDEEKAQATKQQQRNEIRGIGNILGATKGFFKEKSKGYKVLSIAEKAFRAFELAQELKNQAVKLKGIAITIAEKGKLFALEIAGYLKAGAIHAGQALGFIAKEQVKSVAAGQTAVAAQAQVPVIGPALAAGMIALLAGIGILLGGGGGKKGSFAPTNEGTGTVFGDKNAKSESIKRSIDLLAENSKIELPITSAMLRSLQNIEANIGGLTNLVIRSGGAGDELASSVETGFKMNTTGKALRTAIGIATLGASELLGIGKLVGSLFGTKIKVKGQGFFGGDQKLGDIFSQGFDLQEYVDIQKKKKSFGITTKTTNSTKFGEADAAIERQFTLIFEGFYEAVQLAAKPLGENLDDVTSRLDNFVVSIGKINLKGLKGEEIQEKLEAVFGAAADSIAQAALPGLEDFQKVGEGYFETAVRVASGIERARLSTDRFRIGLINFADIANKQGDVTVELFRQSITAFEQSAFGFNTGVSQIVENFNGSIDELEEVFSALLDMRQQLNAAGKAVQDLSADMIKGAGSFEALKDGLTTYFEEFLSQEEQAQSMTNKLTAEFARLNLAVPQSKDGFVALVKSIDTSTAAGQALFGSVIALSPAFLELQNILEDIGIQSAPNLLNRYVEMEARFTSLGLTMPKTTAAFDALLDSLLLSDTSVVDLSKEFAILTSANQRLAETNSSVSSQTDTLRSKFAALGLEIPTSRIEFDNLILTLRGATGSSNTTSLAVESLSSEFNRLIISTKEQQAAALAVGFAYDNLNASTSTISGGTSVLANQVRALSSDFYEFQIQLAEFGGEAGQAIASVFEALFSARQNVQQDVAKITGQDKLVMSSTQIRAGISSVRTGALPALTTLNDLIARKLNLTNTVSGLNNQSNTLSGEVALRQSRIASENPIRSSLVETFNKGVELANSVARSYGLSLGDGAGGAAFGSLDTATGQMTNGYNQISGKTGNAPLFRDIFYNSGQETGRFATDAQKVDGMSIFDAIYKSQTKYQESLAKEATLRQEIATLTSQGNAVAQQRTAVEAQLQQVNKDLITEQDNVRKLLQNFALDAEKNIKRLDKLRVETVRYYETQKALSDLMTTSANKLASSLKSVRDSQLTPVQLLNQLQSEFTSAYAKAQVATGDALVNAANNLDALIKPLLDQAAVVYATGSEASNIREFVLGAGDEIVARLEALRPKDFEAESLGLLGEIDSALFSLEEASSQANKLLIAAIDLSRVQTVAELEQITRVLGGTPVDKSQFVASAKGNAFMGGSLTAFAKGGMFTNSVVSTPTIAPMAYFGEAGPEAIMPLARGGDGSLGVRIVGGNTGDAQTAANTAETNRQLAALVRLQQAGNKQIIEKLSQVEERLATVENKTRLAESA